MWQRGLDVDVTRPIVVVDNEVLIAENSLTPPKVSPQLVAYSLQTGSQIWTLQLVSRQ